MVEVLMLRGRRPWLSHADSGHPCEGRGGWEGQAPCVDDPGSLGTVWTGHWVTQLQAFEIKTLHSWLSCVEDWWTLGWRAPKTMDFCSLPNWNENPKQRLVASFSHLNHPYLGLQQNRECQYTPRIAIVVSNIIINHGIWWFQKHHPLLCQAPSELYIYMIHFIEWRALPVSTGSTAPWTKWVIPTPSSSPQEPRNVNPGIVSTSVGQKSGGTPRIFTNDDEFFLSLLANWGS